MKKLKFIVIISIVLVALTLLVYNGTVSKVLSVLLNYPNYVIITADEYYSNTKLQQFIQYKTSQGFTVQLVKVSDILNSYPISNPSDSYFLKVQNFENIQSSYTRVYALWYDETNKKYIISAYQGLGGFKVVNASSVAKPVYLYIEGKGSGIVYLTFDGGKTFNVTVPDYPYCYTYFGEPLVTVEGTIYYNKTKAYSIVEFLKSNPNIQYLLLIGSVDKVPSFSVRRIDVASEILYYSLTDYPYCARNFETTNKVMIPSFSVSRIPCDNVQELETALDKAMKFKPYMTKNAVFIEGPRGFVDENSWNEVYLELRNSVNQSLHSTYPDIYTYELVEPDANTFLSSINSENSYVIMMAHGYTNTMIISSYSLTIWEIYDNVKFHNSTIVTPHSCLVNDFSHFQGVECIGEAFLFDSDSNVPVFVGSVLPTNFGFMLLKYFYYYISLYKTVGDTFVTTKKVDFAIDNYVLIERLIWNILGDASLNLIPETTLPPTEYGWLDISFTVNSQTPTENALFAVTFPNSTTIQYQGTRITVSNCPVGTYQITCTYNNETKTQTVNVLANQGTKVTFDFSITQQTASLHIYCNIQAVVSISGAFNSSRVVDSSGWHLTNIPVGTYYLTATCDDVTLYHTVTLKSGDDVSYTFQFEVYVPTTDYMYLIQQYAPFMLIGFAIVLVVKW